MLFRSVTDLGLSPGDELFEAAYGHLDDPNEAEEIISTDDIDRMLDFQIDRLQRMKFTIHHL